MVASEGPAGGQALSWRKAVLRWAGVSLAIAAALETALWLMWWYGGDWLRSLISDWLFDLYMPAMLLDIAISGDPHKSNAAVAFLAELLQTFLMIFPLAVAIMTARYLALGWRRSRSSAAKGRS